VGGKRKKWMNNFNIMQSIRIPSLDETEFCKNRTSFCAHLHHARMDLLELENDILTDRIVQFDVRVTVTFWRNVHILCIIAVLFLLAVILKCNIHFITAHYSMKFFA
jgi:hypothetical protein